MSLLLLTIKMRSHLLREPKLLESDCSSSADDEMILETPQQRDLRPIAEPYKHRTAPPPSSSPSPGRFRTRSVPPWRDWRTLRPRSEDYRSGVSRAGSVRRGAGV